MARRLLAAVLFGGLALSACKTQTEPSKAAECEPCTKDEDCAQGGGITYVGGGTGGGVSAVSYCLQFSTGKKCGRTSSNELSWGSTCGDSRPPGATCYSDRYCDTDGDTFGHGPCWCNSGYGDHRANLLRCVQRPSNPLQIASPGGYCNGFDIYCPENHTCEGTDLTLTGGTCVEGEGHCPIP